jgi:sn-glycerol 3-phosphate transport system ATP-binding protein
VSAISVRNASKVWGSVKAVDGVSFEAGVGKLVVLLGPSGCGKSTTLRLIAGLEPVTSGRILIGNEDVTELPPAARHIAMVFQSYALFPHLSVAENIVFGLKVRRVPAVEREKRLTQVAELLGLERLLDRKPSQLSGGQQQRVALGRAIIAEKPVCLMDEPLSNLDAQLRVEMRREIRALQQKLGITMLYVTHDQTEAMTMADQVILLREGRVEQDAPPAEMYTRPATLFAARFIGTPPMNILRLAPAKDGAMVAGTEGPIILRGDADGVLAGVRPEDVQLLAREGAPGLPARVTGIEYLGADSIVTCVAGSESLAVRAQGRVDVEAGTEVRLVWPARALQIFQASSDGHRVDSAPPAIDVGIGPCP